MMNSNIKYLFIVIGICLLAISCKKNTKQTTAQQIISEWIDKQILLSEPCLKTDTYNVLFYADSTGCTDCRLQLLEWKQLIAESDSLFADKLGFLFFFQPKDKEELTLLLQAYGFDYPVFIDETNEIDRLNHFPKEPQYQCFLLDKDNRVLAIGNPVQNPKVWELYKKVISD